MLIDELDFTWMSRDGKKIDPELKRIFFQEKGNELALETRTNAQQKYYNSGRKLKKRELLQIMLLPSFFLQLRRVKSFFFYCGNRGISKSINQFAHEISKKRFFRKEKV